MKSLQADARCRGKGGSGERGGLEEEIREEKEAGKQEQRRLVVGE